jgi:hypothetical protein
VTFMKIRSHRRKFSNSDSVGQKIFFFCMGDYTFLHFLMTDLV